MRWSDEKEPRAGRSGLLALRLCASLVLIICCCVLAQNRLLHVAQPILLAQVYLLRGTASTAGGGGGGERQGTGQRALQTSQPPTCGAALLLAIWARGLPSSRSRVRTCKGECAAGTLRAWSQDWRAQNCTER